MSRELIVQISDPHIRTGPRDAEAAAALRNAVETILRMDPVPAAVLLTGDLTDTGAPAEYARVFDLLSPLPMPVYPVPGNHDDRDAMRAALPADPFERILSNDEWIQYPVDVGSLRVLMLDTLDPGLPTGRLGRDRLDWIAARLDPPEARCVMLAMHHPPVLSGIDALDALALHEDDRAALGEFVSRSPKVDRIVGGHLHRAFTSVLAGVPVFVCPSVHEQAVLDLRPGGDLKIGGDPPGLAVHVHGVGRHVVSHIQPL